jgi:hypothetical protein
MVGKRFDLISHNVIVLQKLSFNIWDVRAEDGEGGFMKIYASMKVPENIPSINQENKDG